MTWMQQNNDIPKHEVSDLPSDSAQFFNTKKTRKTFGQKASLDVSNFFKNYYDKWNTGVRMLTIFFIY